MGVTLRRVVLVLAVTALLLATGCQPGRQTSARRTATEPKGPISVGSKIDTEGELLATMIQLTLEAKGFKVEDKSQTGPTEVVREALLSGEIDIYPEYTGSGLLFFKGDPQATPENFKDPQKAYEIDKKLDEANGVVWLTPAKANNTWSIATRKDFAGANGISTVSDFAAYVKSGKTVKLAASDEFFNNVDAWPAFAKTYGIELGAKQRVTFSGGNTAQTEKVVAEGTDGVNFAMAYGTDGSLAELGLIVLEDDKKAQFVYWPTPVARAEVIDKYPEIEDDLKPVFESLTLEKLQELNARIQVEGKPADAVAEDYLRSAGFIE